MSSKNSAFLVSSLVLALVFAVAGCQPRTNTLPAGGPPTPAQPSPPAATAVPEEPGSPSTTQVQVFAIALENDGRAGKPVGCLDSVVAIPIQVDPTDEPLHTALQMLLSTDFMQSHLAQMPVLEGSSGWHNAFQNSSLEVVEASIDAAGTAHVQLTGEFLLGGMCDDPRVKAQLEETIFQFSDLKQAEITINGLPFEQYFRTGP